MRAKIGWLMTAAILAFTLVRVAGAQDEAKPLSRQVQDAIKAGDPDNVGVLDIKGGKWTLDFKYADPEAIVVLSPEGKREVYWYVLYTVTNHTGEDRSYVPSFTIVTDRFQVVKAGIYPSAFKAIQEVRKIRFLENTARLYGTLRVGPDNAKTGVALFRGLDPRTDALTLLVGGLSGEFVERPRPDAPTDAPTDAKVIRLAKTLELKYNLPGDEWWTNLDKPIFVSKKWTWR